MEHAKIGTELGFVTPGALSLLQQQLPDCRFVDATDLIEQLRAVKSPREIDLLRRGTQLTEAAIASVVEQLRPGMRAAEIARRYRLAAHQLADDGDLLSARITLRAGRHALSARAAWDYQLQRGDLIMIDAGVDIAGYRTDMGRSFVLGPANPVQRQIYAALRQALTRRPHSCNRVHGLARCSRPER